MMTQEEYVDGVLALSRQGKTIIEIADELGYHPATISKWLRNGGPPPARSDRPRRAGDRRGVGGADPPAGAAAGGEAAGPISVFEIIAAEGFAG